LGRQDRGRGLWEVVGKGEEDKRDEEVRKRVKGGERENGTWGASASCLRCSTRDTSL